MGLLKEFLTTRKNNKQTALNLEEENKHLKAQIEDLKTQIKEMEADHAEEIAFIDREFLSWYHKQNNKMNREDNKEERPREEVEPLDLETKSQDLEIGDLLND